ncbi:helix-turn-helix domain-containing protein [Streptosporangium sp. NBC_01495]|uniref:helix-turn-helix domain-containing protein n=1 Tax=Streptosporangium sp. NBC_01495 TaxID=2903899 RepID=UPI002E2FFCCA|nr:helix-turn-helix transcriptional regulator [Streptosporangium sp. NBC_01495]
MANAVGQIDEEHQEVAVPRQPDPVDPSQSPWHLLGATLRHYRELTGDSLQEVASKILVDYSLLARWERGARPAPADAVRRLDIHLNAGGILIALHGIVTKQVSTSVAGAATMSDPDVMDQARRNLLAGLAALGASAMVPPTEGLEQLRAIIDHRVGLPGIAEWEERVWEYGLQIPSRPPASMVADLSLALLAFQKAMAGAPGSELLQWMRVNARLALLLATVLGHAGNRLESWAWWATARRAALQTGDNEAIALVDADEAIQGFYEDRPSGLLLSRLGNALALTQDRPNAATARALATRSQLLAMLGDHAGARASLDQQARVFDSLPNHVTADELSVGGWTERRLLHTRSLVHALSGHPDAEQAQSEALRAHPRGVPRGEAQLRLHGAISAVRNGDVDDGLEHARSIVMGLGSNVSQFVIRTASMVADAVPASDQSRTTVRDYREWLALPAASL